MNRVSAEVIECGFLARNSREESSVTEYIVIVKNPILHAPQIWSLSLNVLLQMPENIAIELLIDGLALGHEFLLHNTVDAEKKQCACS